MVGRLERALARAERAREEAAAAAAGAPGGVAAGGSDGGGGGDGGGDPRDRRDEIRWRHVSSTSPRAYSRYCTRSSPIRGPPLLSFFLETP